MDADRFDRLARRLGTTNSRRAALKGLAAGGLGAALGLLGRREAGADHGCRHNGRRCTSAFQCCSGACKNGACCKSAGASCSAGSQCCSGRCKDGTCCNGLGKACSANEECCAGGCNNACCKLPGASCTADSECCAGGCEANGTCGCAPAGAACARSAGCCSNYCRFDVCQPTCAGTSCSSDADCCEGVACAGGQCDGCGDAGNGCSTNDDCCFSDCTNNACLSPKDGPCAQDFDCGACYSEFSKCPGACANNVCTA